MNTVDYLSSYMKSKVREMWNRDISCDVIARRFGLPLDDLIQWLMAQPGYPDLITGRPGRPIGFRLSKEPRPKVTYAQPY